jgi:hypothetical protein
MHARRSNKAFLLLLAGSALVVGCELIVDFDRTKIPIEDAGIPETSTNETGAPDATDEVAPEAGSDADAADAADSNDAAEEADAPDDG